MPTKIVTSVFLSVVFLSPLIADGVPKANENPGAVRMYRLRRNRLAADLANKWRAEFLHDNMLPGEKRPQPISVKRQKLLLEKIQLLDSRTLAPMFSITVSDERNFYFLESSRFGVLPPFIVKRVVSPTLAIVQFKPRDDHKLITIPFYIKDIPTSEWSTGSAIQLDTFCMVLGSLNDEPDEPGFIVVPFDPEDALKRIK